MGASQIPVDRQRPFAFGDALGNALADDERQARDKVADRGVGPKSQRFDRVGLGRTQSQFTVVGAPSNRDGYVDLGSKGQGVGIVPVDRQRAIETGKCLPENFGGRAAVEVSEAKEDVIHRFRIRQPLRAPRFGENEFLAQAIGEPGHDLVLHLKKVSDRLVEALDPETRAGPRFDELHIDPHPAPSALQCCLPARNGR